MLTLLNNTESYAATSHCPIPMEICFKSINMTFFSGKLGYEVLALTGKEQEEPYLKSLGASGILLRSDFSSEKPTPLGKERFAGVVDAVGGNVVANLLPLV